MIGVLAAGVIGLVACTPTSNADPSTALSGSPSPLPTDTADTSTAPAVGTSFTSARYGYAITVPADWTISETPGEGGLHPDEPGVDTFRSGRGHILSVVGEPIAAGTALDAWTCAISLHLTGEHETPVESTESLDVAGRTMRLTRYHLRIDPYVVLYLNAELTTGTTGLTFSMESTTGDDPADEVVFRSIVASLELVD